MAKQEKFDDFDAVKRIVEAIEPFDEQTRDRIIRWALERLGQSIILSPRLSSGQGAEVPGITQKTAEAIHQSFGTTDIRSFIAAKGPKSDIHFAASVAYYHKFEAPERRDAISSEDLVAASRLVNRDRFTDPAKTLHNAFNAGFLDKAGHGKYGINAVGENLVAMVLPGDGKTQGLSVKKKKSQKRMKVKRN